MMNELFTWDALTTLAGAAALTFLIVAYTRRLVDLVWPDRVGTDLYAVLIASIILVLATAARTAAQGRWLTWQEAVLALFNGFLVAAAAGKINDKAIWERDRQFHQDAGR